MGRIRIVAAVVAALVVVLALSGTALSRGSRHPGVRVSILGASQRTLLAQRAVRVRISVRRAPAVVRAAAAGSLTRTLRFRRPGARVVALPLSAATRRAVARCSSRRLSVRAGRARAARALVLDSVRCRPTASGRGPAPAPAPASRPAPVAAASGPPAAQPDPGSPEGACDFLDPTVCLQPWPNDYFTKADSSTSTGRRLDLQLTSMPANSLGKPIEPTDMNRADGFSPGNPIVVHVPGLDNAAAFHRTGAVPITDMARYADLDQPVVVIDAATGERHPVWSEIDASAGSDSDRNLIVRPAVNFREGHRYIVALRNLRRADGSVIEAPASFRAYRDGTTSPDAAVEARRPHMDALLDRLSRSGIARGDLYLAWDFTVASEHSLTGRMLAIRDAAFAELGDTNLADLSAQGRSPDFTVDKTTDFPDGKIAREVEGHVTVPCFLNLPGCPPGATFSLDAAGNPIRIPGNTTDARFTCRIPRTAMEAGHDARPSLYGHGLFGSRSEVHQGQLTDLGGNHNILFCATDWIGMACSDLPPDDVPPDPAAWQAVLEKRYLPNCDLPVTLTALQDLSNFPKLADRVQQGMLNFMFLGRAMLKGFDSDPAFQRADGSGVIDTTRLFYDGNSQGGIIGGALAAVEPDLDRASIGVPGMNYSTLLSRSVDFHSYATGEFVDGVDTPLGLYDSYPNELQRPLLFGLMQLLWDRAEADGYAQHMTTDPLPNSPVHHVLMSAALGDHQVANIAAETEARTIGAAVRTPYVDPGRSPYTTNSPFGLGPIGFFPYDGSAITMWDSGPIRQVNGATVGTDVPPTTNTPPADGQDPHELPRRTPADQDMKSAFLSVGGRVIDTCGGAPCHSVTG